MSIGQCNNNKTAKNRKLNIWQHALNFLFEKIKGSQPHPPNISVLDGHLSALCARKEGSQRTCILGNFIPNENQIVFNRSLGEITLCFFTKTFFIRDENHLLELRKTLICTCNSSVESRKGYFPLFLMAGEQFI